MSALLLTFSWVNGWVSGLRFPDKPNFSTTHSSDHGGRSPGLPEAAPSQPQFCFPNSMKLQGSPPGLLLSSPHGSQAFDGPENPPSHPSAFLPNDSSFGSIAAFDDEIPTIDYQLLFSHDHDHDQEGI